MNSRWQHVRQRKIVQWAIAYLAVASLLVGITSDVAQGFEWAIVVLRVLIAVLATGFFALLVVAWYHGEKGQQRVTSVEAVVLAALVSVGAVAAWVAVSTSKPAGIPAQPNTLAAAARVAVLPCDNIGGRAEFEFLAGGLAEQVIARLTQVSAVRPIALNSVLRYRGSKKDYRQIADDLEASAILDCSIRQADSRIRVTFHLVDASTQAELWAEPFVRNLDDLLGFESEVARQVARGLDIELSASEASRMTRSPRAKNQEAWFEYLRGLQLTTPMQANLQDAVSHFSNAIELDSAFAPAYAGLADALTTLAEFGLIVPREARDSAKAAAEHALILDDKLGEGYAARGWVAFWFDWDWTAAEADLERALELNPSSAKIYHDYAHFLVAVGRHAEAIKFMAESVKLDPLNPFAHSYLAWAQFHAGRRTEAIGLLTNTMRRFPEHAAALSLLVAWFRAAGGEYRGALAAAAQAETGMQDEPWPRTILAVVYARAGDTGKATQTLASLEAMRRKRYIDPRSFAFLYAALGDTARALDELEAAYRLGSPQLVFLRAKDFLQDPLQQSPRYQALVQKMRFPDN